jgi:hypothetical protein
MAMGKGFYWNEPKNPGNQEQVFGNIIAIWWCRISGPSDKMGECSWGTDQRSGKE